MTETPQPSALRQVPLLPGESVVQAFSPREGLLSEPVASEPMLVVTSHRLVAFSETDGRREATLVALPDVTAGRVKVAGRSAKPLAQGLTLIVIGIIAYFAIGLFVAKEGLAIPLAVGGGIILVGVMFVLRFLFWEEEGSLVFQCGPWELEFPFRSRRAATDAYRLLDCFFQAKLGIASAAAARQPKPATFAATAQPAAPPPPSPPPVATPPAPGTTGQTVAASPGPSPEPASAPAGSNPAPASSDAPQANEVSANAVQDNPEENPRQL